MDSFKYQLHLHTSPCSHCGKILPDDLAENLHKGGYAGAVITNHFFNGNTGIDQDLPWSEFVRAYEDDWLTCKKSAEKYDLDILFGIEEHIGGGLEMLFYGITPEMLYSHPELSEMGYKHWCDIMHSYGVLCIQAHPFREKRNIEKPGVLPLQYIDGIEVFNSANDEGINEKTEAFAKEHPELILTSGADAHWAHNVCLGGIESPHRIRNERELCETLRRREHTVIK
ncbi:MAG: PHP domain-containing protein [Clostridia bacterium]|nr:PHP domain-containing protein [Clostridia bacterium]